MRWHLVQAHGLLKVVQLLLVTVLMQANLLHLRLVQVQQQVEIILLQ